MSNMFSIKIKGDASIPTPSNITFGNERIGKEERAMDGTMIVDLMAIKESLEVSWDAMNVPDMDKIRKLVGISDKLNYKDNIFFDIETTMQYIVTNTINGVLTKETKSNIQKLTVYLAEINQVPHFVGDGFIWKEVTLKFVER